MRCAVALNALERECPDFGHARFELHRQDAPFRAGRLKGRFDGRQLFERRIFAALFVPDLVVASDGRGVEAEAGRLANDEAEVPIQRRRVDCLSSMPNGATQTAVTSGSIPGTAGAADSMPT